MLFDITLRLIVENSFEIMNSSAMIQDFSPWMRSTLCQDQAIKWAEAKVHVYSDSVLCLGKMHGHPEANENWKKPDQYIPIGTKDWEKLEKPAKEYAELDGIYAEPTEFGWNISSFNID